MSIMVPCVLAVKSTRGKKKIFFPVYLNSFKHSAVHRLIVRTLYSLEAVFMSQPPPASAPPESCLEPLLASVDTGKQSAIQVTKTWLVLRDASLISLVSVAAMPNIPKKLKAKILPNSCFTNAVQCAKVMKWHVVMGEVVVVNGASLEHCWNYDPLSKTHIDTTLGLHYPQIQARAQYCMVQVHTLQQFVSLYLSDKSTAVTPLDLYINRRIAARSQ
jgi:hypothetical protein